jgi:hypothetical protein
MCQEQSNLCPRDGLGIIKFNVCAQSTFWFEFRVAGRLVYIVRPGRVARGQKLGRCPWQQARRHRRGQVLAHFRINIKWMVQPGRILVL